MEKQNAEIWSYFIILEEEVAEISKYIEFSTDNYATYSNANAKSILSVCSEIDVLLKEYCLLIDSTKNYKNIVEYRQCIASCNDQLLIQEICLQRYGLKINPWKNVSNISLSIDWWSDYNKIKHDRLQNYNLATLKNLILSCGALYSLVVSLIKKSEEKLQGKTIEYRDITYDLFPETKIYKFSNSSYYYNKIKMWIE